jgi:hypothetical protein
MIPLTGAASASGESESKNSAEGEGVFDMIMIR